jgi:4,5-DOPA dioxygenase extradiol
MCIKYKYGRILNVKEVLLMLPSLFIAHGAPTIIVEDNDYTNFLKNYSKNIKRPKGIIIFSAHWESPIQLIGGSESYEMIYDFYGFPKELYNIVYPAASDMKIAQEVQKVLNDNNIPGKIDSGRGIDHGAWTILKLMYPEADIPVITMSVNTKLKPEEQYAIGKCLSKFKAEDYLIICSGGIVHNLGAVSFNGTDNVDSWAIGFNDWIKDKIYKWEMHELFNYEELAPNAKLAVPRNEHFLNLLIALGTGDSEKKGNLLKSMYQFGNLSLDFWEFK